MNKSEVRPAATARQRGESPKSERRPKSETRNPNREQPRNTRKQLSPHAFSLRVFSVFRGLKTLVGDSSIRLASDFFRTSDFGFRPSFGLRTSDFGLGALLLLLLSSFAVFAQPKAEIRRPPPLDLAEAEEEGRALVADLLRPPENATNTGLLTIYPAEGNPRESPVRFEIFTTPTNWVSTYEAALGNGAIVKLTVIHTDGQPNQYLLSEPPAAGATNTAPRKLSGNQTMIPFAGSDFWVADLGLEFFHWPKQHLLKKEMRRSRFCNVLESVNPQPAPGGYSRVDSWLDSESGGPVLARACDARGQLLKDFEPKEIKKIHGQWQLEGMEIRNLNTGSRTRIEFNLKRD